MITKIFLWALFLTVATTYILVFNNSRLPLLGMLNINEFGLHTLSFITNSFCFAFTVYAVGNKKLNKDYLSVLMVITSFASFSLTILLINGVNGAEDWIFSFIIGLILTCIPLLIAGSKKDVLESEMRFQE